MVELQNGDKITATRFENVNSDKILLINAATGIRQYFYYNYAKYLNSKGYTVYTYDYRGIGDSKSQHLKHNNLNYVDWGSEDYPAMVNHIKTKHPNKEYYLIGHSFGGSCIGMSNCTKIFDKVITISSQNGYWKFFPESKRLFILFFSYISLPVISWLLGYYPSKIKGLGESLPKGVALDWSKALRNIKSIPGLVRDRMSHYKNYTGKLIMISIEDDWMASKLAVDKLSNAFSSAEITRHHITLNQTNQMPIGHINFFKQKFKDTLWSKSLGWLN